MTASVARFDSDSQGDLREIQRGLRVLLSLKSTHEVRALGVARAGTVSGYYDQNHRDAMGNDCLDLSGDADGVYTTLNPVNRELLARSANRLKSWAKHTTSDADILRRRWLPIDLDPARPSGISSTDSEHQAALDLAGECQKYLVELGIPKQSLVMADSGNGAHLLCRLNLPNDEAARKLIQQCIDALAARFSNDAVKVDRTTYNAARIWKLPGTLARKGDSLPHRPHRVAKLLMVPKLIVPAPLEIVQQLAGQAPPEPERVSSFQPSAGFGNFDLEAWLAVHQIATELCKPWQGGRMWVLKTCPWNPAHTNGSAFIIQHANGAISARCHHDGCSGKGWRDLRALFEPDQLPMQKIDVAAVIPASTPSVIAQQFEKAIRSRLANNNS